MSRFGRSVSTCFGLTSSRLRELWEKGVATEEGRNEILEGLNQKFETIFKASCVLKIWSYGSRTRIHTAQINVNVIEAA